MHDTDEVFAKYIFWINPLANEFLIFGSFFEAIKK